MNFHYMLMKTHSVLSRRISYRAQKELGLSLGQPKVLDCLLENEGSDQKTIAAICEIEPATLGSILVRMEEKGLIERRQLEGNRRSLYVFLTEYGKETAQKMKKIFDEEDSSALKSLTENEKEYLNVILEKICKEMNQNLEV